MILKLLTFLLLSGFISSCHHHDNELSLAVIGVDEIGNSKIKFVDKSLLNQHMGMMISNISNNVSRTLDNVENSESVPWELSRVTVGLKLEAEFEILDDVLEVENEGDLELRFQKI
jgi:hypothetical protein